jgi:hypothetical protein
MIFSANLTAGSCIGLDTWVLCCCRVGDAEMVWSVALDLSVSSLSG